MTCRYVESSFSLLVTLITPRNKNVHFIQCLFEGISQVHYGKELL